MLAKIRQFIARCCEKRRTSTGEQMKYQQREHTEYSQNINAPLSRCSLPNCAIPACPPPLWYPLNCPFHLSLSSALACLVFLSLYLPFRLVPGVILSLSITLSIFSSISIEARASSFVHVSPASRSFGKCSLVDAYYFEVSPVNSSFALSRHFRWEPYNSTIISSQPWSFGDQQKSNTKLLKLSQIVS